MANVNLRSLNVPEHFIRHSGFRGMVTRLTGPIQDFSFAITRRGEHLVSLRSANFPNRMLRHRNFEVHLDPISDDELFRRDSTFRFVEGLADPAGVSFESVNLPGAYLRHRDFLLWVEAPASPTDMLFRRDATFVREPARVLIDHGTELNPVND